MSRVAAVQPAAPCTSSPAAAPFVPDYVRAAEISLAFARPLAEGLISFGELEDRLLPLFAGPEWDDVELARDKIARWVRQTLVVRNVAR